MFMPLGMWVSEKAAYLLNVTQLVRDRSQLFIGFPDPKPGVHSFCKRLLRSENAQRMFTATKFPDGCVKGTQEPQLVTMSSFYHKSNNGKPSECCFNSLFNIMHLIFTPTLYFLWWIWKNCNTVGWRAVAPSTADAERCHAAYSHT